MSPISNQSSPPSQFHYDRPVQLQVACLNLRHKLMYVDARHSQRGLVDDSSGTRIFWCAKTQDALGPDGETVSPSSCCTGRACYLFSSQ